MSEEDRAGARDVVYLFTISNRDNDVLEKIRTDKGDVLQIIRFFAENGFQCIKTCNLKYVPFAYPSFHQTLRIKPRKAGESRR